MCVERSKSRFRALCASTHFSDTTRIPERWTWDTGCDPPGHKREISEPICTYLEKCLFGSRPSRGKSKTSLRSATWIIAAAGSLPQRPRLLLGGLSSSIVNSLKEQRPSLVLTNWIGPSIHKLFSLYREPPGDLGVSTAFANPIIRTLG
jgi:hypothetical protein